MGRPRMVTVVRSSRSIASARRSRNSGMWSRTASTVRACALGKSFASANHSSTMRDLYRRINSGSVRTAAISATAVPVEVDRRRSGDPWIVRRPVRTFLDSLRFRRRRPAAPLRRDTPKPTATIETAVGSLPTDHRPPRRAPADSHPARLHGATAQTVSKPPARFFVG